MNNLKNLLKNAGLLTVEISKLINEICENCAFCKTNAKHPSMPIAGLSRATAFKHTIAMDLLNLIKIFGIFI